MHLIECVREEKNCIRRKSEMHKNRMHTSCWCAIKLLFEDADVKVFLLHDPFLKCFIGSGAFWTSVEQAQKMQKDPYVRRNVNSRLRFLNHEF